MKGEGRERGKEGRLLRTSMDSLYTSQAKFTLSFYRLIRVSHPVDQGKLIHIIILDL